MKPLFLFVAIAAICLFPQAFTLAQEYTPMNFEDGIWLIESYMKEYGYDYDIYYSDGDTIINDSVYSKLYYTHFNFPSGGWPDTTHHIYWGAIAEFENKTVWAIPSFGNRPRKAFDFNIDLGDTIDIIPTFVSFIVKGIDSVEYCGRYHKRYYESLGFYPVAIIEGIGYSHGIIGFMHDFNYGLESYSRFTCYAERGNPECPGCNYITSTLETQLETEIFPNPTDGQVRIVCQEPISKIKVFSIKGNTACDEEGQGLNSKIIDLSTYPPGPYIIVLISENDRISVSTIIKKE